MHFAEPWGRADPATEKHIGDHPKNRYLNTILSGNTKFNTGRSSLIVRARCGMAGPIVYFDSHGHLLAQQRQDGQR